MSKKVLIDPGHAPGNGNKGANGYYEYAGMWKVSNYLKAALERCGMQVALSRTETEDLSLSARGKAAVSFGADLFISEHSNAATGTARGVEVYYSMERTSDKAFAASLSKSISNLMGNPDRGAKTRESTTSQGKDYYTVMYAAAIGGIKHVLLVESGFHDNLQDEAFLLVDSNLQLIAETQAKIICEFLGVTYISVIQTESTPILNTPTATVEQARAWAKTKRATDLFVQLADIFWIVGRDLDVDPAVMYCQSAKETGYGKFGGVLDESYCNPCGLKTKDGGGDLDKEAHQRFDNWLGGILAQGEHLALYAGKAGYPKAEAADLRHFPFLYGTAQSVEALGGKWAPSESYGTDIVKMMKELQQTALPSLPNEPSDGVPQWQKDAFQTVVNKGYINTPEYWAARLGEPITIGEMFAVLAKL